MPLDGRVLGFAIGATLFAGVVFGLIPALQASRTAVASSLRDGIGTGGTGHHARLQATLVAAQVALAIVSLVSAGLFVRGQQQARAVQLQRIGVVRVEIGRMGAAARVAEEVTHERELALEIGPALELIADERDESHPAHSRDSAYRRGCFPRFARA